MKTFVYFFVLITFLCCRSGYTSSSRIDASTRERVAKMDPTRFANLMFEQGAKNKDYTDIRTMYATGHIIRVAFPRDKTKQKTALNTWIQNVRNQKVNGKKKYTEKDISKLIEISTSELEL